MSLQDRSRGSEFAGYEWNLLFDPDNKYPDTGYVRFDKRMRGLFYLDPSPTFNTLKNERYILECEPPQEAQLIKAIVRETKDEHEPNNFGGVDNVLYKYVSGWYLEDPNKIRGRNLFIKDEFLNFIGETFENGLGIEDLETCIAMYMCSSPQLSEFEKGGINTTIIEHFNSTAKWNKFNQITKIVPNEFRKPSSRICYFSLTSATPMNPVNCCELNIAYKNIVNVPIQIPMPFNINFKKQNKENWDATVDVARTFILDALLFQPQIPEGMDKLVEETMYQINESIMYTYDVPCSIDVGSLLPKLTTSLCRLNFMTEPNKDDLKNSLSAWSNLVLDTHTFNKLPSHFEIGELTTDEITMLNELQQMKDTGIELLISTLKQTTSVFEWNFEKTLKKLKERGTIYFPRNDKIGLINDR